MIRHLERLSMMFLLFGVLTGADSPTYMNTKTCGQDEAYCADVDFVDGKYRLNTTGLVQIDQLFGQYPKATTWAYIGTKLDTTGVGSAGDTWRTQIPAGANPDGGACAAVDVTTTVTAGMVADDNPEIALAAQIVLDLNADSNFGPCWKAQRPKDYGAVFIESDFFNSYGVRGSWTVTTTGTTVATKAWDDIIIRGLSTELAQSPNDPTQGVLGIAGSLQVTPGGAVNLFNERALLGGSPNLNVDGSVTTQTFCVSPDSTNQKIVQYMTFSGTDNGIKYGQFLAQSTLTNGIVVRFKSQNVTGSFEAITDTDRFEDSWSRTPSDFSLEVQSGGDHFNGTKDLTQSTIIMDPIGTYATDDYVCVDIQDNLTSVSTLLFRAKGFTREP